MSQFPNHGKLYHQSAFRPVYPAIGHPDFENPKPEPKRSTKISPKRDEEPNSPKYVLKKEADDSSDSNESRDDDAYSKNGTTPNEDEDETVDIETTDDLTEVRPFFAQIIALSYKNTPFTDVWFVCF